MKILILSYKEIVFVSPTFVRLFHKLFRTTRLPRGIAFWPFIAVRDDENARMAWLINHERIHLAQQRQLLILGAWVLKTAEVLYARLILKMTREAAYFWLSAEQEAYLNQHNPAYLQTRPLFAQLKYLRNKKRFRVTPTPGELQFY